MLVYIIAPPTFVWVVGRDHNMNHDFLTCLLILQMKTQARHIAQIKKAIHFEGYKNQNTAATAKVRAAWRELVPPAAKSSSSVTLPGSLAQIQQLRRRTTCK